MNYPTTSSEPDPVAQLNLYRLIAHALVSNLPVEALTEAQERLAEMVEFYREMAAK